SRLFSNRRRYFVRKFTVLVAWLAALLILLPASGVYAQADASVPFAAIQDGKLTLFGLGDTPLTINNPPNKGFFSLAWSPDGTKLAYVMNDEQFLARLLVVDVTIGTDPVTLNTGTLESGFPVTFAPDGKIIYIAQGTFPTDVNQPYHSD